MEPQPGGRVQANLPDHDGLPLRSHGHGVPRCGGPAYRGVQVVGRLPVPAAQVRAYCRILRDFHY
jgi:hypothetical protein